MSAAPCPVSAAPDRIYWSYEPLGINVTCTLAVLEKIRQECVDCFSRLAHGGLETGGILVGKRTGQSVEILAALPVECEHRLGPSFLLSQGDEASFQQALASSRLQPIGIYMSHSRRGFALAEADISMVDRYFPEPWQIALLLMPSKIGPTRAGFFIRASAGQPGFVCAHEMALSAPERHAEPASQPDGTRPIVAQAVARTQSEPAHPPGAEERVDTQAAENVVDAPPAEQRAKVADASQGQERADPPPAEERTHLPPAEETAVSAAPVTALTAEVVEHRRIDHPNPVNIQVTALQRLQSFFPGDPSRRKPGQSNLIATVALLLLLMFGGGLLFGPRSVPPLSAVPVRVSDSGEQVRIEWDPVHPTVRAARAATLEIRDGGKNAVVIPMTREALDSGRLFYIPQSANIEVRFKLTGWRGAASESVVYFINPTRRLPAPAVNIPATPEPPAATIPVTTSTSAAPVETAPLLPREKEAARPTLHHAEKKAPKLFQLPDHRPANATSQRVAINLPEAPDIHPSTQPVLASPSAFSIATLLTSRTQPVGPPILRNGHLIWTGELRKNSVLTFSPTGASSGVLNGRLPGVPVKISLEPAELVEGGIAIYTREARSPSTWNGWNIFFYDWDPKRLAEVSVLEPPSSANNWKRLVLRNSKRNVSVVVVDWQRTSGQ